MEKIQLPSEVAKDYEATPKASRVSAWGNYRHIDLNSVTPAFAKKLVKQGFPYLRAKSGGKSSLEGGGSPSGETEGVKSPNKAK